MPRPYWRQIGEGAQFTGINDILDSTEAVSGVSTVGSGSISTSTAAVGLNDGTHESNMFRFGFTLPANFTFTLNGIPHAKYDLYAYISARNGNVQTETFTFAGETIAYNAVCPGWTGSYMEGNGGNTLSRTGLSGPSQTLSVSIGSALIISVLQLVERLD